MSNKTIGESMSCLAARMASCLSFINCSVVITSPVKASWNCVPTGCRNWEQRTVSDATAPGLQLGACVEEDAIPLFRFLHHLRVVLPVGIQPHRLGFRSPLSDVLPSPFTPKVSVCFDDCKGSSLRCLRAAIGDRCWRRRGGPSQEVSNRPDAGIIGRSSGTLA